MKIEKIIFAITAIAFILAASHQSLAADATTNSNAVKINEIKDKASRSKVLNVKNSLKNSKNLKNSKKKTASANKRKSTNSKTTTRDSRVTAKNSGATLTPRSASTLPATTATTTDIKEVKKEVTSPFSGSVDFTVGKDSNIDPGKTDIQGTFFQIDPTLNFKSGGWSGSFGASIKDYKDPIYSEIFKKNEAKAEFGYEAKISKQTTSTTKLNALYHDERWPDYMGYTATDGKDESGVYHSMPIRYSELKLTQSLGFDLGSVKTEIGGSAKYRDYHSLYTDYSDKLLGEHIHERDHSEITAFGKVTLAAASFLDLSASPSIKQSKYDERLGRQPDGRSGGTTLPAPNYELITSEIGFDVAFKLINDSNITPKAVVGQVADQAMGAEDNSYYGFGLSSSLVLDKATKLTLTPNFMYKKINYDNWTNSTDNGDKRVDDETSGGIDASIMLTKNFGAKLGYSITREKSNISKDTSENYRQEIVSSALSFTF